MASKGTQKGNQWEFVIKRAGLLDKPLYLRFPSEPEGVEYCRKLEALLDRGIIPPQHEVAGKQLTVGDVIDRYQREVAISGKDKDVLNTVAKTKGTAPCLGLDAAWVDAWIHEMKHDQKLAPATIRAKVGSLARATDWAVRKKLIILPDHPLRTLPEGYAQYSEWDAKIAGKKVEDVERDRRLEVGEEASIREVLAKGVLGRKLRPYTIPHLSSTIALFDLALESAMRMREMYTLTVDQVNLKGRTVFLDNTKNGDSRQVPLSTVAVRVLEGQCRGKAKGDLIFPWLGEQKPGKLQLKMTTNYLSKVFSRVFDEAGCPDFIYHDIRHEAVSRLFEKTNLLAEEIMKISGHKSHRMMMRYLKLRSSDLASRMW